MSEIPAASALALPDDVLLSVRGLKKYFPIHAGWLKRHVGDVKAIDDVSLDIRKGETLGLVGESGSGKSTVARLMLRAYGLTEGQILFRRANGEVVDLSGLSDREMRPLRAEMQMIFQDPYSSLNPRMTLLELVGAASWAHLKVGTYSKGMGQRIGLAQALVNEPEVVFLDEPTDGVDPEGRIEIRKMIERMRAEGRTVFVNSHLLAEVEQVADQVAILARGKVIESGPVAQLTRRARRYEIRTLGPVPLELRDRLTSGGLSVAGDSIALEADDATPVQPVIDALRAAGVTIREIKEARYSLEEIFLQALKGQGKEAA